MEALSSALPLVLLAAAFYLLILRPARRRTQAQRQLVESLSVGAEVLMAGGLIGTVVQLDEETMLLEVAPGVTMKFVRSAVARITSPIETPERTDPWTPDSDPRGPTDR